MREKEEERAVQGQISKLLRAKYGTFDDKSGEGRRKGGKRLVWIGIGLEFEPRRVFQRGLNGVFFRWCDSSRANEESRGGGRKDDAIVT